MESHETLAARRKYPKVRSSKPCHDIPFSVADLVKVSIRVQGQKRGKWSSPLSVLDLNRSAYTVTVTFSHDPTQNAATKHVLPSIGDDSLTALVRYSNNELNAEIETVPEESFDTLSPEDASAAVTVEDEPDTLTSEAY